MTIYFVVIGLLLLLNYLMTILILLMAYRIKNKKLNILWPLIVLRIFVPFFSNIFFSQSFLLFMTVFSCEDKHSYISPNLQCRSGTWFKITGTLTGIGIFLQTTIAIITNVLYFKPIFINTRTDLLKKTNSSPDIVFIISKIGLNLLFSIDRETENMQWAVLFLIIVFTGSNAYVSLYYQNRVNKVLNLLNNFFSLVIVSQFISLLIGKMFEKLEFSGSIYLFFSFIIIISIYIVFYKNKETDFLLIDYKEINNPVDYLYHISSFYNIIQNKKKSRNYFTVVESLISKIEENCIIVDCPLKKYLDNIKIGIEYPFLLNQFFEILFEYGISKFSDDIFLKNNYSIFLITDMNYQKKALIILNTIQNDSISFQNKYYIYRTLRLLEKKNISLSYQTNSTIDYRKNVQDFKTLIKKLTLLYYEFFSLLLASKFQNSNNFNKIHKIGREIMKKSPTLDELYNKLMTVKTDNSEIIRLYSEFVEGILNNEEKLENCLIYSKLKYNKIEIHDKNFSNFSTDILNEKENTSFLIISAKKENLGKIIDFSMNVSKIFGYSKEELIGQHINILIPKLFHKLHDLIILEEYEKNKFKLFDTLNKNEVYFPDFIKKDVYGITKLKFLIKLKLSIYFIKTEENKLIYIVEILNNVPLMIDLIKNTNNNLNCCVLTDENFLIQSFTPNCIEYLKLNYSFINSNICIINFIKEFQDDYLTALNNTAITKYSYINNKSDYTDDKFIDQKALKNTIPPKVKKKIKNDLFIKKYSRRCKISWKINDENSANNNIRKSQSIFLSEINNEFYKSNIITKNKKENNETNSDMQINLYMEIDKIKVKQELIGYYFYFSKLKTKNQNNISYTLTNNESNDDKNYLLKVKKYHCIFDEKDLSPIDDSKYLIAKKVNTYSSFIINTKKMKEKNDINKIIKRVRKKSLDKNLKVTISDGSDNYSLISNNIVFDINKTDNFVVTGDFIPDYSSHFLLDLNNFSFLQLKKNDETINYLDILKKEADDKIKDYHNQLNLLSKESKISSEESEEIESEEISSEEIDKNVDSSEDSSFENSLNENLKPQNSITNSDKKDLSSKVLQKYSSRAVQNNSGNNSNFNGNAVTKRIQKKNSIITKYYKVNLTNVKFMIFDFNKDMFVEGNKNEKVSKIETIMMNSKNQQGPINFEKDERFSFLTIFKSKKNKIINKENNSNNVTTNNDNNKNQIDEEKIFKKKLFEALNKQKDEPPIKKLKIYSGTTYIILAIIGIITIIFDLNYISKINQVLTLIKNTLIIKYCSQISIYYLRELTLLNFNIEEIKGGKYENFPDNSEEEYEELILDEIVKLFVENQLSMKNIYSSSISLSKSSSKTLSESRIIIKMSNNPKIEMNYDILTSLMQYNCAFYNFASSTYNIAQNHTDIFNFIYNNLNGYKKVLNILLDIYSSELNIILKAINIIVIILAISFLIGFTFLFILLLKLFLASIKRRGNYMEVFYGMNENILKALINNCENLINKLKSSEEQKYYEDETMEETIHDNMKLENSQKINRRHSMSQNININYDIDNKMIVKASNMGLVFIVIYGLFTLISYIYFIYNGVYMINFARKSILIYNFCYKMQNYQLGIIEAFNVYREYLFDNESMINNMTTLEYLKKAETEDLLIINQDLKFINSNQNKVYPKNANITQNKSLCSYYKNEFFDSSVECNDKIGLISYYDFDVLSNYFLEEIKIDKNIAQYKLKNEKVLGNLTEYNIDDYISDENIPRSYDFSDNTTIFRLDLFNNETLHENLNIIFFSIILPYIEENKVNFFNILFISGADTYLTIFSITFEVLLTIVFLFYLIPIINYINNVIYKTKNMLSIIPLSILASQNGVSSLLNISNDK